MHVCHRSAPGSASTMGISRRRACHGALLLPPRPWTRPDHLIAGNWHVMRATRLITRHARKRWLLGSTRSIAGGGWPRCRMRRRSRLWRLHQVL